VDERGLDEGQELPAEDTRWYYDSAGNLAYQLTRVAETHRGRCDVQVKIFAYSYDCWL